MHRYTRRTLLAGGGLLVAAGLGTVIARPEKRGGMHDGYYTGLSAALKRAGLMRPTLVIDRTRLNANIAAIRKTTDAAGLPLRVVAKSLPSPGLLDAVMKGVATDRLMVFSADMLLQLLPLHPNADYLMGKPLPVSEFVRVAELAGPEAAGRVQWLIDTDKRMAAYTEAAGARGVALRANFEIDVGLHRGGFADPQSLAEAVMQAQSGSVTVAGLMGYDPHVPKMPDPEKAYAATQSAYQAGIDVLAAAGLSERAKLTLNGGGSPTVRRHCTGSVANEVSVGSAFVKPGDFDLDDLGDLRAAAFIATPVIKSSTTQNLAGLDGKTSALHWFDRNSERGFFIHGGHWLAKPVSPPGLQYSGLFGRSSNQELLTGSNLIDLQPDDMVFLRPDQSEALFLQFGDLAVFEDGEIVARWPTLPVSA